MLSLPMVRFVEPLDSAGLDLAIAGIEHFDWILFTSANAVRFFLARCRALDFPFESTESDVRPRIAVVGPATRDALELQGLGAKGEPKEFSGTGLIAALADDLMGKRVLLPRSDRATGELPAGLRAAGASVTEVVAYLTIDPGSRDTLAAFDAYVVKTLERGDADAVTFFSPSAFQNFARALGDTALRQMGARVAIAALGPVTAAAIRSAGRTQDRDHRGGDERRAFDDAKVGQDACHCAFPLSYFLMPTRLFFRLSSHQPYSGVHIAKSASQPSSCAACNAQNGS